MTPTKPFKAYSPALAQEAPTASTSWDVQWSRPVFRAPPLEVDPPLTDIQDFIAEIHERTIAR